MQPGALEFPAAIAGRLEFHGGFRPLLPCLDMPPTIVPPAAGPGLTLTARPMVPP
jgi:hypothetical protein